MNNAEKREFISESIILQSKDFYKPKGLKEEFLSKVPKTLFKYKKFDEHTYEMIENNYIYLASYEELDDPFEFNATDGLSETYDEKGDSLTKFAIDNIISTCLQYVADESKKEAIKEYVLSCLDEKGNIVEEKILKNTNKLLILTEDEKFVIINTFGGYMPVLEAHFNDGGMKNMLPGLIFPEKTAGICSLSEILTNKSMWSLYADKYAGYCIEYEINEEMRNKLYPVIYEDKGSYNVVMGLYTFTINGLIRHLSKGTIRSDMSSAYSQFITKDIVWEHQKEWRIVGNKQGRINNVKIKAIYLGTKVNLENKKKMLEYSKTYNFDLYQMELNKKNNSFTFHKIK